MICSLQGDRLFHITLGLGHNNDRAMLQLSGMKEALLCSGQKFLGDSGYYSAVCILPDSNKDPTWNSKQKALRSVVERVIGSVMSYGVARGTFRASPELHALALMTVYHCVEYSLSRSPLVLSP